MVDVKASRKKWVSIIIERFTIVIILSLSFDGFNLFVFLPKAYRRRGVVRWKKAEEKRVHYYYFCTNLELLSDMCLLASAIPRTKRGR